MIFVGIDWSEQHHDVEVLDSAGGSLARVRIPEGLEGIGRLHGLLAEHAEDPAEVVIGIETDHGLLVGALVAAGYQVFAINPQSVDRYRDRHSLSGAQSDPGDAKVLADLVRTDRHNHRPVAGDSDLAEAIKVTARAHQSLIWTRQRQVNQARSALREYYPGALAAFGTDLASPDALPVLAKAPTPAQGRRLSAAQIAAALRRAGRRRNVDARAAAIRDALRAPQLAAPPLVADAYGDTVKALVEVIAALTRQITELEAALADRFEQHPDAGVSLSLPGLGVILGARVLAEFGDDPNRYAHATARKNYAGSAPITKASGKHRVVLARYRRNHRLADAITWWAFCSLTASPGARVLRPPPRQGRHPPPGPARAVQPLGRHPPRLPPLRHGLPGGHRLGPPRRETGRCRLTTNGPGISRGRRCPRRGTRRSAPSGRSTPRCPGWGTPRACRRRTRR